MNACGTTLPIRVSVYLTFALVHEARRLAYSKPLFAYDISLMQHSKAEALSCNAQQRQQLMFL